MEVVSREEDGGATFCIASPELDGEVETVRERLRLTKPVEEGSGAGTDGSG